MPASIQFVKSAVFVQDFPPAKKAEVAIAGRSNAGKSSFLNALGGGKLAKVSSTPGKTRLLNFFSVNNKYTLVDMPGYGFAARSGDERDAWRDMIEPYLGAREALAALLIIMDIRRDWSEDEENLVKWISRRQLPVAVILTKADKMSRGEALTRSRKLQQVSGVGKVLITSSLKKEGFKEIEDFVFDTWIKPIDDASRGYPDSDEGNGKSGSDEGDA